MFLLQQEGSRRRRRSQRRKKRFSPSKPTICSFLDQME
jgi:hypothetical protein